MNYLNPLAFVIAASLISASMFLPPALAQENTSNTYDASYYCTSGKQKYQRNDYSGAIKDFTECLRLEPNHLEALIDRGLAKVASGDSKGAVADYTLYLNSEPNDASAYYKRGQAYESLHLHKMMQSAYKTTDDTFIKAALADYAKAIQFKPDYWSCYHSRIILQGGLGNDRSGAIQECQRVLQMNPPTNEKAAIYALLGGIYSKDDNKTAYKYFSQAIAYNSQNDAYYIRRAAVLTKLGDKKGALADYNQAILLAPEFASYYIERAEIKTDLFDINGALQDIDQALKISPNDKYALSARAKLTAKPMTPVTPANAAQANTNFARAKSLRMQGQLKEALPYYNAALRLDPNSAQGYYARGTLHQSLGNNKESYEDLTAALQLDPKHTEARRALQELPYDPDKEDEEDDDE